GLVWSRMPSRRQRLSAVLLGGIVMLVSGVLLANAIDFAHCAPVASWADVLPASLAIGFVIGIGPALGALAAASVAVNLNGWHRVAAAVAIGGIIGFLGLFIAIGTLAFFFPMVSCGAVPS
ncbi:MAG TPA: hypothetical protein VL687_01755, partial [Methylomirabilota bacterium]|nr:hypothetical protein [Methylomirabilota bacterium]